MRHYEKDEKECKEKAVFTSQQTLYYTHKRTKMDRGQLYQFFHFLFDFPPILSQVYRSTSPKEQKKSVFPLYSGWETSGTYQTPDPLFQ